MSSSAPAHRHSRRVVTDQEHRSAGSAVAERRGSQSPDLERPPLGARHGSHGRHRAGRDDHCRLGRQPDLASRYTPRPGRIRAAPVWSANTSPNMDSSPGATALRIDADNAHGMRGLDVSPHLMASLGGAMADPVYRQIATNDRSGGCLMAKRHSRPSRQYRYEHYDSSGRQAKAWVPRFWTGPGSAPCGAMRPAGSGLTCGRPTWRCTPTTSSRGSSFTGSAKPWPSIHRRLCSRSRQTASSRPAAPCSR
jgi:hypothetical protein